MMLFRHKKTGKMYRHLAHGTDCTNSRDGTGVVLYCPDDNEHTIYIRETAEFHEKFEMVMPPTCGARDYGERKQAMDYYALAHIASGIGDGNELSGDAVQRFGELVATQAAMIEREECAAICKRRGEEEVAKWAELDPEYLDEAKACAWMAVQCEALIMKRSNA